MVLGLTPNQAAASVTTRLKLATGICLIIERDPITLAKEVALDKAMAPRTPVDYWSADELQGALEAAGFRVRRHLMVDLLPYPHVLYIARRCS